MAVWNLCSTSIHLPALRWNTLEYEVTAVASFQFFSAEYSALLYKYLLHLVITENQIINGNMEILTFYYLLSDS